MFLFRKKATNLELKVGREFQVNGETYYLIGYTVSTGGKLTIDLEQKDYWVERSTFDYYTTSNT
jgi:hypothetical protein